MSTAIQERVLILRNQGIGDLLLITPAIRAIRRLHPNAHISVMVGRWSAPVLEQNPNIDEILSYPDPWIQNKQPLGYLRLISMIRKKRFGIAYIFHSHPLIQLMTVLGGIKKRYGFFDKDLKKTGRFLAAKAEWQPNTNRYIADNYLDIPRLNGFEGSDLTLDFFLSDAERAETDVLLKQFQLFPKKYIVVAPGGGVNPRQNVFEKRWGTDNYIALCTLISSRWEMPIILTGSAQEVAIGQAISEQLSDKVIDLIGQTDFRHSAGLIENSYMLISNDSSVMHIAVARGIPSLSIFGPSNPRALLPDSDVNQWITSELDCSPCYCNSIFTGCDHLRCMFELSADSVFNRLEIMRKMLPALSI